MNRNQISILVFRVSGKFLRVFLGAFGGGGSCLELSCKGLVIGAQWQIVTKKEHPKTQVGSGHVRRTTLCSALALESYLGSTPDLLEASETQPSLSLSVFVRVLYSS